MKIRLLQTCFVLFSSALAGCAINPPVPSQLAEMPRPQVQPIDSTISLPIAVDFSAAIQAADGQLDRVFDAWGAYTTNPNGPDYKYYAERGALSVSAAGSRVSLATDLGYKVGVRVRVWPTWLPFQCGDGNEWPRRARLVGDVSVSATPDFGLAASVGASDVQMIDGCSMGAAGFANVFVDVNGKIRSILLDRTNASLNKAVEKINQLSFKQKAQAGWDALLKPISLAPSVWLSVNPRNVSHSGLSGTSTTVTDTFAFTFQPVVTHGPQPPAVTTPLPQLGGGQSATGFHVITDGHIEYETLSSTLLTAIKGKRIYSGNKYIEISDVSIYGNGGNQIVVRIDFDGTKNGHVFFVGKPQFDALTQTLSIGELDYDLATKDILLKVADWIYHSTFRDFLVAKARFDVGHVANDVRAMLAKNLNRDLSENVSLSGTVNTVQGVGVFAGADKLYVRARADGDLRLAAKL